MDVLWQHAPLIVMGRPDTTKILTCRAGTFRGRPAIAAVRYELSHPERWTTPRELTHLLVTSVRLDVPLETAATMAYGPDEAEGQHLWHAGVPDLMPNLFAARDVPAPA
ncbi:hypothetical protein ACFQ07_09480, partial [Actinomadura adrarensis]